MRAKEFINESETYQPPELKVGDRVNVGKFKNVKAEIKGFSKDKNNQPTIKTNKGTQQLFKPRIMKLMPEERSSITDALGQKKINEIDYAHTAGEIPISHGDIIMKSEKIGHIDDTDVFLFNADVEQLYYFKDNDQITAYIIVDKDNNLRGMKNNSGRKGQITALVLFVARNQSKGKLKISTVEKLTDDGFAWLRSAIKLKVLNITDQTGHSADINKLSAEWKDAKNGGNAGSTELIIESMVRLSENKAVLMPRYKWIGQDNLI